MSSFRDMGPKKIFFSKKNFFFGVQKNIFWPKVGLLEGQKFFFFLMFVEGLWAYKRGYPTSLHLSKTTPLLNQTFEVSKNTHFWHFFLWSRLLIGHSYLCEPFLIWYLWHLGLQKPSIKWGHHGGSRGPKAGQDFQKCPKKGQKKKKKINFF